MKMRSFTKWLLVPVALVAAACGGSDKAADDSLKNDLALASQMQPYQPQQFMSPTEAGLNPNALQQPYQTGQGGYYPQQSQPVYPWYRPGPDQRCARRPQQPRSGFGSRTGSG